MPLVVCEKCNNELCAIVDSADDEVGTFRVKCTCGKINYVDYIGPLRIASNETFYFEFVDEDMVQCKYR